MSRMDVRVVAARFAMRIQNAALWLQVRVSFRRPDAGTTPERILVYRTGRLGDFINALPAITEIRRRFPRARIALLTTPSTTRSNSDAVARSLGPSDRIPWLTFAYPELVDEVFEFRRDSSRAAFLALRRQVKSFRADAVFILGTSLEGWRSKATKLLFFSCLGLRAPVFGWRLRTFSAGFRKAQWRAGMLEHQAAAPVRCIAEHPALASLTSWAGSLSISAPLSPDALDRLAELPLDKPWIAVFPGGTYSHKQWDAESFVQLCERLAGCIEDAHFVFVGGPDDRPAIDHVRSRLTHASSDLGGRVSLDTLRAVLSRCTLYVGNDSGPTHLASAVGCPTVSIMSGIEFPGAWEPWNHRQLAVRHDVPCVGCYGFASCPNGTRRCLAELSVDVVFDACLSALKAPRAGFAHGAPLAGT